MISLPRCAALAPKLRIAATADFTAPGGTLSQLQACYGGFQFKEVITCEPGLQYSVLNRDDAEVAAAFTTDPNIVEEQLVILADSKGFWPRYGIAPAIRTATLRTLPRISPMLDKGSLALNQYAMQELAMKSSLPGSDARDVAEDFVRETFRHTRSI